MAEETEVKTGQEEVDGKIKTETVETDKGLTEQQKLRQSILEEGKEESPEDKIAKQEEEFEEYDREELEKEFPFLKMEQFKDKSLKEILSSYGGGLDDFNKLGEIKKVLEEAGIKDPQAMREAILKLKTGGVPKPDEDKTPIPKNFAEFRKGKLAELIPGKITDENGERPLTEQERQEYLSEWENRAEHIFPSGLGDTIHQTSDKVMDLIEENHWLRFRLEPLLEANKDKLLGDDVKQEIIKYFEQYPLSGKEIIAEALKKGANIWKPLYEHFILRTKGDEIAQKKVDKILQDREEEAKKRAAAKTETKKTKGEESLHEKSFDQMNQNERKRHLLSQSET